MDRNKERVPVTASRFYVALLAEGVDRNHVTLTRMTRSQVALLAEGVDRNYGHQEAGGAARVALLAEGVDRNPIMLYNTKSTKVALLAEGVDRNVTVSRTDMTGEASPSSRRAWIEISSTSTP